jgi:Flp pilus assembly protein TadG
VICTLRNLSRHLARRLSRDDAAQLVEFAISLPLLVVFVVGIFDFSGAYTLKQKLTNVAGTAARTVAGDPASDLLAPSVGAIPASVLDAFNVIHNYLAANKLNDCGLIASGTPTVLSWTFTATGNGCPAPGISITINRGYYFPLAAATTPTTNCVPTSLSGQTAVVATCVSISYPYSWKFGNAANLLGRTTILPNSLTAAAVAMNEH